jgi:sporulation protein YlmC with PRC-barrel domain
MKFNDGAEVYTADGKKLGHLGQVILNSHTKQVTNIVVHKGIVFTSDKVIPVKDIQQTLADRVTLQHEAKTDAYPDFLVTHFVPLIGDDATANVPSPVLWYPPLGMMVYNPMFDESSHVVRETENIPAGTQALAIGSKVITHDGKLAGHVEEVFMESSSNEASHILVSKGTLPSEKLVPINWIKIIDRDQIELVVVYDLLLSLPDYNRSE